MVSQSNLYLQDPIELLIQKVIYIIHYRDSILFILITLKLHKPKFAIHLLYSLSLWAVCFLHYRESSQHTEYLRVNLCESNRGTGFPVDQSPQSGFALDDAVWHSHLAAQSRQEDHQLKRKGTCCVTEGEHPFIL